MQHIPRTYAPLTVLQRHQRVHGIQLFPFLESHTQEQAHEAQQLCRDLHGLQQFILGKLGVVLAASTRLVFLDLLPFGCMTIEDGS